MEMQRRKIIFTAVASCLFLLMIWIDILIYYNTGEKITPVVGGFMVISAAFLLTWIGIPFVLRGPEKNYGEGILQRLCLLDEENRIKKAIDLQDKSSVLIGETISGKSVALDISYVGGLSTIGLECAVLNKVTDIWYIEALGLQFSVGLKKSSNTIVYKLKNGTIYKLEPGDVIYIGRERLLTS